MGTRKGVIYSVIFFLMFPVCFQVVGPMKRVLNAINNFEFEDNTTRIYSLWVLAAGILSGLFIVVMMGLYNKIKKSYRAGKWISLVIVWANHLYTILPVHIALPQIVYNYFLYIESKTYMILIVALAVLIIVDIIKDRD